MKPKQAWGAVSVIFALGDALLASVFIALGYVLLLVVTFAGIAALIYVYIVYKRYHVEVVPESDVLLFDDVDDLRILCNIYGLGIDGDEDSLRKKLTSFSRANAKTAFVWVAPRSVLSIGSGLSIEAVTSPGKLERPGSADELAREMLAGSSPWDAHTSVLPRGEARSTTRLMGIKECPVCGSQSRGSKNICAECGADLEFYAVLSGSKVGKRMVSAKASAVRRRLRYQVPPLGVKI